MWGRQRQYHSATGCELLEQRLGHARRRGRYHDRMKRRRRLEPRVAVAMRKAQVGKAQADEIAARALEQRLDALDRVHLGKNVREHRRLVTAAGTDFERLAGVFAQHELDHPSDHERVRDRLPEADRQRVVLVGAARERLLDEEVARHGAERGEHALVGDALGAQARDHARARALRGHADACAGAQRSNHSRARGNCDECVRSMRSGVTETRWLSTAWKSVPGPASAAAPAGPIQYALSPPRVASLITRSAL